MPRTSPARAQALRFGRGNKSIMGMTSSEKESFSFQTPVAIEGAVESWMAKVEHEMRATLYHISKAGVFYYAKTARWGTTCVMFFQSGVLDAHHAVHHISQAGVFYSVKTARWGATCVLIFQSGARDACHTVPHLQGGRVLQCQDSRVEWGCCWPFVVLLFIYAFLCHFLFVTLAGWQAGLKGVVLFFA